MTARKDGYLALVEELWELTRASVVDDGHAQEMLCLVKGDGEKVAIELDGSEQARLRQHIPAWRIVAREAGAVGAVHVGTASVGDMSEGVRPSQSPTARRALALAAYFPGERLGRLRIEFFHLDDDGKVGFEEGIDRILRPGNHWITEIV